ncbi:hypothetical protein [Capnocytophaga bilenii]|uniref:hypothetical protein n=1 Tax=Capnocytophaga bilenii TaxID=2819369 RepID=UPI0028D557B3|nr:hypothetical protein [Capnocytophaga bilenii]
MFDTLQIQRTNKVQALHTPCALGYTAFDEMHCSDLVASGRADARKAAEFRQMAANERNKYEALKQGDEQKAIDDLNKTYSERLLQINKLNVEIEEAKILLAYWQQNPEKNYEHYLATGKPMSIVRQGLGGFWSSVGNGLKKIVGGVASAATFGHSCDAANEKRDEDAQELSNASDEYARAVQKYNDQIAKLGKDKQHLEDNLGKKNQEVKNKQAELAEIKEELKKAEAALAERKKADEAKAKANNNTPETKSNNTTLYIIGGVVIAGALLIMMKRK